MKVFLDKPEISRLVDEHVATSETLISSGEIKEAIGDLKPNMAPGLDGFTAELIRTLQNVCFLICWTYLWHY